MAKTKPIGVRFPEDLLEIMKEDYKVTSPQKVLNFLADFWKKHEPSQQHNFVEMFEKSPLFNRKAQNKPIVVPKTQKTVESASEKPKAQETPKNKQIQHPQTNGKPQMPKGLSLQAQIDWKIANG